VVLVVLVLLFLLQALLLHTQVVVVVEAGVDLLELQVLAAVPQVLIAMQLLLMQLLILVVVLVLVAMAQHLVEAVRVDLALLLPVTQELHKEQWVA
jgi:hypothetical protein